MIIVLVFLILEAYSLLLLTRNYKYWQKRGVPCVDGALPGFGHMLSMICMRTNLSDFSYKIYKDHKGRSMVGLYNFTSPSLMILEPELVKTVLQTNFSNFSENTIHSDPEVDPPMAYHPFGLTGDKWRHNRKRLTYAFSSMRLKILLKSVKQVCVTFEKYIDEKMSNVEKAEFEMKALFVRYSAQAVAGTGFGVEGYCFDNEKNDISFRKLGQSIFEPSTRNKIVCSRAPRPVVKQNL